MKKNNMKLSILVLPILFFLTFQVYSASAAITITCTPCNQGNCNCNINTCPSGSGLLTVYKTSDCSDVPIVKLPFTSSSAIWFPDSFGSHYAKALCDDETTKSDCIRIDVSQIASSCSSDACVQQCKNQGNLTGTCNSNNQCQCSGIATNDKCSDGTTYGECSSELPKFCNTSGNLVDDCNECSCPDDSPKCNSDGSCSQAATSSGGGDSGIWIWIIIIVIIVGVVLYFLVFKKKKKQTPKASYEDLYKKWSK